MKKFILKCILFGVLIMGICAAIVQYSRREPGKSLIARWTDSTDFTGESGMISYFEKALSKDQTTQMITGDSICRQMFHDLGEEDPKTSVLASNAALMITGQYLLTEQYLENHPDATDVWLIMHPLAITRTFDTEWSYRYAVMPYVETDTIGMLDENTLDEMASVYGRLFMQKPVVELIEESPLCRKLYLSYINTHRAAYEQSSPFEIADQYVKKMYDLCEEKGVQFHLYASPAAEAYRSQIAELEESYGDTWMSTVFPDYFSGIVFYPSEWAEDLSHFSGEHAERASLNEMIRQAYADTWLAEMTKIPKD
jgi:hypothetical protein